MKKKVLIIISAVAAALLIVAISLSIVLSSAKSNDESYGTPAEGSIEGSDYLSGGGGETVSFPDESGSVSDEESVTETETETVTETETETETMTETEAETETETETEKQPSLEFLSYGNGTCAVSGIGDYNDVFVIIPEKSPSGDVVIAVDDMAFLGKKDITAVYFPSTVMSIGDRAFGGCESLVYISVDSANKSFTEINGVLFSKDMTKLILFPSASPSSELTIPISVTEICDMAFYSTPSLKHIKYGGTVKDWANIKVGEFNYGLYSASMTFAAGE